RCGGGRLLRLRLLRPGCWGCGRGGGAPPPGAPQKDAPGGTLLPPGGFPLPREGGFNLFLVAPFRLPRGRGGALGGAARPRVLALATKLGSPRESGGPGF